MPTLFFLVFIVSDHGLESPSHESKRVRRDQDQDIVHCICRRFNKCLMNMDIRLSDYSDGESVAWTIQGGWRVNVYVWWFPPAELHVDWHWWNSRRYWPQHHSYQLFVRPQLYGDRQHHASMQCLVHSIWPWYVVSFTPETNEIDQLLNVSFHMTREVENF